MSTPHQAACCTRLISREVVLLCGEWVKGWIYGTSGMAPLTPMFLGGFKTLLALCLLEMGISTAKVCLAIPHKQWRILIFTAVILFVLVWAGIILGLLLDLSSGSILVLAGLSANAAYIAAPATIKAAIPDANIGLTMLASRGITFQINVLIGLAIYQLWIAQILG